MKLFLRVGEGGCGNVGSGSGGYGAWHTVGSWDNRPSDRSLVGDRLGSGVSGSVALAAGSRMRNVVTGALRSLLCSAGVW